jgi:hypothetical protein
MMMNVNYPDRMWPPGYSHAAEMLQLRDKSCQSDGFLFQPGAFRQLLWGLFFTKICLIYADYF